MKQPDQSNLRQSAAIRRPEEGGRPIAKRGPKTEAGKKKSSRNSWKHGLRAVTPVVDDVEVPEIWQEHLEGMFESLQPEGYHERELAGRITEILWRLRRVALYEKEIIKRSMMHIPEELWEKQFADEYGERTLGKQPEPLTLEDVESRVLVKMVPGRAAAAKIVRYEAHLHRMYIQTLHELEALQGRRRGERVPLARLDISAPPAG